MNQELVDDNQELIQLRVLLEQHIDQREDDDEMMINFKGKIDIKFYLGIFTWSSF